VNSVPERYAASSMFTLSLCKVRLHYRAILRDCLPSQPAGSTCRDKIALIPPPGRSACQVFRKYPAGCFGMLSCSLHRLWCIFFCFFLSFLCFMSKHTSPKCSGHLSVSNSFSLSLMGHFPVCYYLFLSPPFPLSCSLVHGADVIFSSILTPNHMHFARKCQ
jgi:hypothetical protein